MHGVWSVNSLSLVQSKDARWDPYRAQGGFGNWESMFLETRAEASPSLSQSIAQLKVSSFTVQCQSLIIFACGLSWLKNYSLPENDPVKGTKKIIKHQH